MPDTRYAVVAVLVTAAVTWALRALPFSALAPLRASATVQFLGGTAVHVALASTVFARRARVPVAGCRSTRVASPTGNPPARAYDTGLVRPA
ncbi:hypothetical protein [Streptomyces niveus]|uniref:hypothetical protein n=1 Tax=Streptomyces niveus TaxID=193462 RepID=UPI001F197B57|nr:hypothetical protein [Streptomyces niveus]